MAIRSRVDNNGKQNDDEQEAAPLVKNRGNSTTAAPIFATMRFYYTFPLAALVALTMMSLLTIHPSRWGIWEVEEERSMNQDRVDAMTYWEKFENTMSEEWSKEQEASYRSMHCDMEDLKDFYPPQDWRMKTPYFLLLGAKKTGTTSMSADLMQHPDVIAPYRKESLIWLPMQKDEYYSDDGKVLVRTGRRHLLYPSFKTPQHKQETSKITFDATPGTIFHSATAPAMVFCLCPWVKKFLVILRDPVERAYSNYHFARSAAKQRRGVQVFDITFEEWLRWDLQRLAEFGVIDNFREAPHHAEADRLQFTWTPVINATFWSSPGGKEAWRRYARTPKDIPLGRGLYSLQLRHWFDELYAQGRDPREVFLIVRSEDFKRAPKQVYAKIEEFLGISSDFEYPSWLGNKMVTKYFPEIITQEMIDTHNPRRPARSRGARTEEEEEEEEERQQYHDIRTTEKPPMKPETREFLERFFQPYTQQLYDLLGPEWHGSWDNIQKDSPILTWPVDPTTAKSFAAANENTEASDRGFATFWKRLFGKKKEPPASTTSNTNTMTLSISVSSHDSSTDTAINSQAAPLPPPDDAVNQIVKKGSAFQYPPPDNDIPDDSAFAIFRENSDDEEIAAAFQDNEDPGTLATGALGRAFVDKYCDVEDGVDWYPQGPELWQRRAPYFLIPGVKKSGTTSLSAYLWEHPNVKKARKKELHLFMPGKFPEDRLNTYDPVTKTNKTKVGATRAYMYEERHDYDVDLISQDRSVVSVDSSPGYLLPSSILPHRILCVMPWVKLVVIVRNPVTRARSNWKYVVTLGNGRKNEQSFQRFMQTDLDNMKKAGFIRDWQLSSNSSGLPNNDDDGFMGSSEEDEAWARYLQLKNENGLGRSMYEIQLRHWFEALREMGRDPSTEVLVVRLEELSAHPREEYARILNFLQLRPYDLQQFDVKVELSEFQPMNSKTEEFLKDFYEPYNKRFYQLMEETFPGERWQGYWEKQLQQK